MVIFEAKIFLGFNWFDVVGEDAQCPVDFDVILN
jgi:hypothetical protein